MKQFTTLLEAAELAAIRCKGWKFATSDERFDTKDLLILAETSDNEDPIDEDNFYVVSPSGAIGLCIDGEDIEWLFLTEAAPNEDLPLTYQAAPQARFCSECGAPVVLNALFCGKCGNRL